MVDMMIEPVYLAQVDINPSAAVVQEKKVTEGGFIHTKEGGRYQIVAILPKKAENADQTFEYADAFGTLRAAGIHADSLFGTDTSAFAVGAQFGFQTASYYGFSARMAAYTSQKVSALNPSSPENRNPDFFDGNGDSFTYIGEANIAYDSDGLRIEAGRVRIDTPYADSDDIRMAPNTFEGVWSHFDITDSWKIQAMYLTRWAGFDSGADQNKFKKLFENSQNGEMSDGAFGASVQYVIDDENDISLWYYHIDQMSDIVYAEAAGDIKFTDAFHIEYGLQGSTITELKNSHVEGDVLGAMGILDYNMLFLAAAVNYAFVDGENAITDGFGGGPYYTSLDESTIGFVSEAASGEDIYSFRIGGGVDFNDWKVDGLVIEYIYGDLESSSTLEFNEQDVIITYDITDRLYLEGIFAKFDIDKSPVDLDVEKFNRYVVRLDYSF